MVGIELLAPICWVIFVLLGVNWLTKLKANLFKFAFSDLSATKYGFLFSTTLFVSVLLQTITILLLNYSGKLFVGDYGRWSFGLLMLCCAVTFSLVFVNYNVSIKWHKIIGFLGIFPLIIGVGLLIELILNLNYALGLTLIVLGALTFCLVSLGVIKFKAFAAVEETVIIAYGVLFNLIAIYLTSYA